MEHARSASGVVTDRPTHRRWAEQRFARLIEFVLPRPWHEGGFA